MSEKKGKIVLAIFCLILALTVIWVSTTEKVYVRDSDISTELTSSGQKSLVTVSLENNVVTCFYSNDDSSICLNISYKKDADTDKLYINYVESTTMDHKKQTLSSSRNTSQKELTKYTVETLCSTLKWLNVDNVKEELTKIELIK